jgi:uncharacterized protein (TIGR03437 family)
VMFVSAEQASFQCPVKESGRQLAVWVETAAGASAPVNIAMQAVSPEIFTLEGSGSNQGAASFDGTAIVVSQRNYRFAGHPAQPGDVIQLWATGLGSTPRTVEVQLGSELVEAQAIRAVETNPGVYAVQVRVPAMAIGPHVRVQLQVTTPDGRQYLSNNVTMAVEAVNP